MFFKRLSRSRSNSQGYVDQYNPHDSKTNSANYDDKYSPVDNYDRRPASSGQQPNTGAHISSGRDMYASGGQNDYNTPPLSSHGSHHNRAPMGNGYGGGSGAAGRTSMSGEPNPAAFKAEAAPDLLTRAFNEALRPYTSRLEDMEGEISDLRVYVEDLEAQRKEVYAWIDKRGLRPGKFGHNIPDVTPTDPRQTFLLR